jgi:threonine dehydrogenase-like Zn-dependent dehydrogenase
VDAVIDAVGIDAQRPKSGPAAAQAAEQASEFEEAQQQVAPETNSQGDLWVPGDAPTLVSQWAVESVAKAGRIGIIGVYSPQLTHYPIGAAMNKNLTVKMGNCNHRAVTPPLIDLVAAGLFDPTRFITQQVGVVDAVEAYESFDRREEGWLKTVLEPSA